MASDQHETWKPCPLHLDYAVSSRGRIQRLTTGRILTPAPTNRGYLKVSLGRRVQAYVHELVAAAFHGPRPAGHHVDHLDFDRTNNHALNLRWLPMLENSVRWSGRTADGRNQWATPDDAPDDHHSLDPDEDAAIVAELAAAGWLEESA